MCHTGFQYTPVASIATCVQPISVSHADSSSRPAVVVRTLPVLGRDRADSRLPNARGHLPRVRIQPGASGMQNFHPSPPDRKGAGVESAGTKSTGRAHRTSRPRNTGCSRDSRSQLRRALSTSAEPTSVPASGPTPYPRFHPCAGSDRRACRSRHSADGRSDSGRCSLCSVKLRSLAAQWRRRWAAGGPGGRRCDVARPSRKPISTADRRKEESRLLSCRRGKRLSSRRQVRATRG